MARKSPSPKSQRTRPSAPARQSSQRSARTQTRSASSRTRQTKGSAKGSKPTYAQSKAQAQEMYREPLFDDRTKRDIVGVVLIVVAIALFVTVIFNPGGMVTSALSTGLRMGFGAGLYLLPFIVLLIAITVLVRFQREHVSLRLALGIGLIYIAILTLMASFTGGAEQDPSKLFNPAILSGRGGYIGAGIAWVCLTLFGLTVTVILMIGLILVGCIVIGFSLSALIEKLRLRKTSSFYDDEYDDEFNHMPSAHIKRPLHRNKAYDGEDPLVDGISDQPTQLLNDHNEATQTLSTKRKRAARTTHQKDVSETASNPTIALDSDELVKAGASAHAMTRRLSGRKPDEGLNVNDTVKPTEGAQTPSTKSKKRATKDAAGTTKSTVVTACKPTGGPSAQEDFNLPPLDLIKTSEGKRHTKESEKVLEETARMLEEKLADFNIDIDVVDWVEGPTVTLFKVDLADGIRLSRLINLSDDIALALASPGVRIFAPVPGTNYVGIEVPNKKRQPVYLGDILPKLKGGPLEIVIGEDVEGNAITGDLAKMPHLLIAGTTGSGKSVSINGMIMSILMRATPAEVRFIMIDPKRVEFTLYEDIPHLYVPVVTEPQEASNALSWCVAEMERRLKIFQKVGARNIAQYNKKVKANNEASNDEVLEQDEQVSSDDTDQIQREELPYIVVVIDELADLMMNVGKEVEFSISRLAQLARAAGIHLIIATQRPSANVVTGLIKANITSRIALTVATGTDSRVILDATGAEKLIGYGDLLLSKPELARPQRIQGCMVEEDEINAVVEVLKEQGEPEYHNDILKTNVMSLGDTNPSGAGGSASGNEDPLLWEAAEIVCSSGVGSTSGIQRRLSVGYSRAGRIMDMLEEKGIVGPANGSKPRDVLVDAMELETIKAFEQQDTPF